jgi:hypothetical protein
LLTFTFYDAAGNVIAPGAIVADAEKEFAGYFAGSGLGGIFLLRAVFPVNGNTSGVVACETKLVNSAGTATTQRTVF